MADWLLACLLGRSIGSIGANSVCLCIGTMLVCILSLFGKVRDYSD